MRKSWLASERIVDELIQRLIVELAPELCLCVLRRSVCVRLRAGELRCDRGIGAFVVGADGATREGYAGGQREDASRQTRLFPSVRRQPVAEATRPFVVAWIIGLRMVCFCCRWSKPLGLLTWNLGFVVV